MPLSPEQTIDEQLKAYNARDIEGFLATYHPGIRVFGLSHDVPRVSGLAKLRMIYQEIFQSSPTLHCEIRNRICEGSFVIDHEWVTGLQRAPEGLSAVAIYLVEAGLIKSVWFTS